MKILRVASKDSDLDGMGTTGYLPKDSGDYIELCDLSLMVQGHRLPVHSGVLALKSRFFRRMIIDLKESKDRMLDGEFVITLDDSVSIHDAVLMLAFVYGARTELKTAQEARRMVAMGDKYDMPFLCKLSGAKLCQMADSMQFICQQKKGTGKERDLTVDSCQDEWNHAAEWLEIADRLNMQELRRLCQYVILRDITANAKSLGAPGSEEALASLERVPPRSMGEICFALVDLVSQGIIHEDNLEYLHCGECHNRAPIPRQMFARGESRFSPATVPTKPTLCPSCSRAGCLKALVCESLAKFKKQDRN